MKHKIIDNFLEEKHLIDFKKFINSEEIPWYFKKTDTSNETENKNGCFNFCFYNGGVPRASEYEPLILPILKKLNFLAPIQVRLNMTMRDIDTISCGFHTDYNCKNSTTAILFLTNCNSKTVLNYDKQTYSIKSVENRILIFPSNIMHKVIYQTDVFKRFVLNLNYFEV